MMPESINKTNVSNLVLDTIGPIGPVYTRGSLRGEHADRVRGSAGDISVTWEGLGPHASRRILSSD